MISFGAGFIGGRGYGEKEYRGPLSDFLLASQGLERLSVIQLLFSSSFSLNGMLYQAWLGYAIGLWALVVQGAWALSYVLLSHYVEHLRGANSLHHFLAVRFGPQTRMLAALCSIIGFTVLIGWEFNVGKSTFEGLFALNSKQIIAPGLVLIFMMATVFACFLYTVIGGLRSNAIANGFQNLIKLIVFVLMLVILYQTMSRSPDSTPVHSAFSPLSHSLF